LRAVSGRKASQAAPPQHDLTFTGAWRDAPSHERRRTHASRRAPLRAQAVWALGNIAGDSPRCRDLVLSLNALPPLLEQVGVGWGRVARGRACVAGQGPWRQGR
jgi:hypothetical protein